MSLKVGLREREAGVFVLSTSGRLDTNTYPVLEARVDQVLTNSPRAIVFDMSGLDYVSSMGVRVIIKAEKALAKTGGKVIMTNLQPQIEKVFEIIKALPSFSIFKNTQEMDNYLDKMQKKTLED